MLGRRKFSTNEKIEMAVTEYFEGLEQTFFKSGIMALETRWKKCIELQGDYIEK